MAKASSSIEDLLTPRGKGQLTGNSPAPSSTTPVKPVKKKGRLEEEITPEEKLETKLSQITDSEDELNVTRKAKELNVPYIDLTAFPVSSEALETVAENVCIENNVICFVNTGEELRLATTDPTNKKLDEIKHNLEESLHSRVQIYMFSERNLKKKLDQYAKIPKYKKPVSGVEVTEGELKMFVEIAKNLKALDAEIKKVNMTEMVTLIVAASIQSRASDIHVETEEADVKVRFRIDGVLHDVASIEKGKWPKVISRLKLISGLKMNITDKPQDGRFTIKLTDDKIDVRVSCLPTTWGESVVMRLLKSSAAGLAFEDLGLVGKAKADLTFQVERPNGMIVTTGPTGSGKTTTLYAILNKLNKEDTKIITLEDPVEYKLPGLNQSQIDHSKGYSFADGLRSLLRQDPDIVMVGELRDLETADVAINAALTGHLVISTIHTNSASGAIPRFLAMEVKPFLLAPAINAIMGQRLVRRICENCKKEIQLEPAIVERVKKSLSEIPDNHPDKPKTDSLKFYQGAGCEKCNGIGFKGRVGIYEITTMTEEIEKIILSGKVSEYEMQAIAIKNGMLTMAQDGILKALLGITTIDEIFRVAE